MKWIIRIIGVLVALVMVLMALVFFMPSDKLARIATDQIKAATGRNVSIEGDVSLTFWPVLGLRANELEVGNASWSEQGPMLQAANAAIGIDVASLLRGEIRITNIEAGSPTIRLDQRLDGRASWQFTDASGDAQIEAEVSPDREARAVSIERLVVTNATLIYDAEGSDLVSYESVDLALNWPDRLGPAQIEATVVPAGSPVEVTADIDGFAGFITGETQTLRASVEAEAGSIAFDGRANTLGAVAGELILKTADTGAFLGNLGVPGVELPPKLGRSIDLQTDLTLTPDRQLALREMVVDLSGNRLTGAADIGLNGVPEVNAQLNAGALDLTSATESSGSSSASGNSSAGSGWPKTTIDASGLAAFNGDIALNAESIDLGTFKLGQTQTVVRNNNSRMVFELNRLAAYGGLTTGEFVINNRNGLSVGGQMNIASIQMQPLLRDAIDLDRLTGQGDMQLSFLGSGSSVDAIMNSLSGSGNLSIGRGTIEGINLDQLLSAGGMSGTTIFDDLTASWTIAAGVLSNRDLLLQLRNYSASGNGVVDLGGQTIDYKFTPVALRANSGEGLAIPVLFKGPWSDVSIRPDVEAALDLKLDAEMDALQDKAEKAVTDRLGVSPTEGQSSEDAITDKVKNELLKKLFD